VTDVVVIPEWRGRAGEGFLDREEGPRRAEDRAWDDSAAFAAAATPSSPATANWRKRPAWSPARTATPKRRWRCRQGDSPAEFAFPFLAHASMEPLNCVMKLDADGCEVWNGEQLHTGDQGALAKMFG
jgi:isoquinoline 1-oxidoreductase beta subunit